MEYFMDHQLATIDARPGDTIRVSKISNDGRRADWRIDAGGGQ